MPPEPQNNVGQTLYLFTGLQPTYASPLVIAQVGKFEGICEQSCLRRWLNIESISRSSLGAKTLEKSGRSLRGSAAQLVIPTPFRPAPVITSLALLLSQMT